MTFRLEYRRDSDGPSLSMECEPAAHAEVVEATASFERAMKYLEEHPLIIHPDVRQIHGDDLPLPGP